MHLLTGAIHHIMCHLWIMCLMYFKYPLQSAIEEIRGYICSRVIQVTIFSSSTADLLYTGRKLINPTETYIKR